MIYICILQIKALLRGHTAFEDYPEHVKDQLAQVFVYQRYMTLVKRFELVLFIVLVIKMQVIVGNL